MESETKRLSNLELLQEFLDRLGSKEITINIKDCKTHEEVELVIGEAGKQRSEVKGILLNVKDLILAENDEEKQKVFEKIQQMLQEKKNEK